MKDRIEHLLKMSGPTFTVQYLKEATRVVQKFIAGQPQVASIGVAVSLINGLPKIIPGKLRRLIRMGDPVTIRGVLTVLTLYKLLKCRPNLKLNTIDDPFTGITKVLNPIYVKAVIERLPKSIKYGRISYGMRSYIRTLVSSNAGPNHKKAFLSLVYDAKALSTHGRILLALRTLSDYFQGSSVYDVLKEEISKVAPLYSDKELILGKLSFLKEPAGKVRVVAILDG